MKLASFFDWNVLQSSLADILGSRPNEPVISKLLQDMSRPPRDTTARENWSEKIGRNAERIIG